MSEIYGILIILAVVIFWVTVLIYQQIHFLKRDVRYLEKKISDQQREIIDLRFPRNRER